MTTLTVNSDVGEARVLRKIGYSLRPWSSVIALLIVWQLADSFDLLNKKVLPGPVTILGAFGDLIRSGELASALIASLPRVLIGMIAGIVLGVVLGIISGFWRLGRDLVDKPMQMVRAVPFTALAPLFILWFGIDELPKIALVFVGTIVPLYINTYSGIRNVDARMIELGRVYRLTPIQIAFQVLFPATLPQILSGLRYGLGLAWVALIVAETIGANDGIGFLLINARQYNQTSVVICCIIVYALLGLITDAVVRWMEAYLLRWRPVLSN